MLDIISDGRLNLGAARGGTAQEMALCGVDPELTDAAGEGGAEVHRPLLARGHDRVGLRPADDPPPPSRPPHTVVPRPVQLPHPPLFLACTNPETVRAGREYGVGPMVLGFGGPEVIGEHAPHVRRRARAARPRARSCRPGMINDEFVALCPTFLMDDRDEAFRKGAAALRFFAEAITHWAAPNGVAPARDTEQGRQRRRSWPSTCGRARGAIARGEAPPTAASSIYNLDHALGDADTAIAYVQRLADAGVDNVMCLIQMGTLTQDQQLETIRIWGEQVIPHFRALDAIDGAADELTRQPG